MIFESAKTKIADHKLDNNSIFQIACLQQFRNDSCGYFALFNAVQVLYAIIARTESECINFINDIQNRELFWRTFYYRKRLLLENCNKGENDWLWTKDLVEEGIMERTYMHYLLNVDPGLKIVRQ